MKVIAATLLSVLSPLAARAAEEQLLDHVYGKTDTYKGHSFLSGFRHEAIDDPTHGRVHYVDQGTAKNDNLTFTTKDTLILRADFTTVLSPSGPGRKSVRLLSNKQYSTHVSIFDVRHMPVGCGTWPAYWTTSATAQWPTHGEIDILEGVNDAGPNHATLHTTSGCIMKASRMVQTGTLKAENCDWQANYNQGCPVSVNDGSSYGPALNSAGGGWYAMERTEKKISVWFWPRYGDVPGDVKFPGASVNTNNWGTPFANFVNNDCDIKNKFGPNNYIINLTFCGDWAGNEYVYPKSCPQSCVNHVNNNPGAFADAYWDIAALRIYEKVKIGGPSRPLAVQSRKRAHHRVWDAITGKTEDSSL